MKLTPLLLLGQASLAFAYLASTTRYYDGQEGACGCGTSAGNYAWQLGISTGVYTAAGSQALFDTDGGNWCGAGCGKCYNLTSTGSSACSTCGTGGPVGESIIVMVTNLCPYNGNEAWCPPVGEANEHGYSYHFDLMAETSLIGSNPIVNFEPVACPGQAVSDWETCVCYGQTATDETPAGFPTVDESQLSSSTSTASSNAPTSTSSSGQPSSHTSTTSSKAPTSTSSSSGATQTLYGQCGGISWAGPTTCASPATCIESNPYYSQCLDISNAPSSTSSSGQPSSSTSTTSSNAPSSTYSSSGATQTLYGQCGGINWTGPTTCASPATCIESNPYYSQCLDISNAPSSTSSSGQPSSHTSTTSWSAPTSSASPMATKTVYDQCGGMS